VRDDDGLEAEQVGDDRVLRSLIKVASHKEENGYYFNPETTLGIIFGELAVPFTYHMIKALEEKMTDFLIIRENGIK
jgi:2-dehydropantoate 2-reductase